MQLPIPLILIALGGAAMVALADARAVLGALGLQWLGVAWLAGTISGGVTGPALVEAVTGLICVVLLFTTAMNAQPRDVESSRTGVAGIFQRATIAASSTRRRLPSGGVADYLWVWAVVLVGGIAGFGLAQINPLAIDTQALLAFYWVVLASVLALVVHGTYNPVKLAAGLLAFTNSIALLLYLLSVQPTGTAILALLALVRIGIAGLIAYASVMLRAAFGSLDLAVLFDRRDGVQPSVTALAIREEPAASEEHDDTGEEPPTEEEQAP